ncbi:MAG: transcription antitermination factor NusB, partial [Microcystaceae cyanobacterium]
MTSARQLTLLILRDIERRDSYTDVALDRHLKTGDFPRQERCLVTELVYGIVRRQRTLDRLIEQFSQKSLTQQPPDLRRILQIGLYQLQYLDHIPPSAAVHTSVELAK